MLNVTARSELLRTIVETLNVVVEDARLDFTEGGLNVRVVDPSHVAMVQMGVDAAAFDTWEVDETNETASEASGAVAATSARTSGMVYT